MSLNVLVAKPFGSNPDDAGTATGGARDGLGAGPNDLAIAQGLDRLRFICPWNGDGAVGAAHMVREVTRRSGQVTWLDTREFW